MAQHAMIARAPIAIPAALAICSRERPLAAVMASQLTDLRWAMSSSAPVVWLPMKSRSSTVPGDRSSSAIIAFMIPCIAAMSPLILTGSHRSHIAVPGPNRTPAARNGFISSCGLLKRTMPTSGMGLMLTSRQPRRLAACRAVSIRGWFVPGFCPMTKMASAFSKSESFTHPLPTPIVGPSAAPLDSWHMFEQSGRLFVPNARAKSWYRNAASLLVRPEV